jgi:SAM-dependent methyltransferase
VSESGQTDRTDAIEWHGDAPTFRGFPLELCRVEIAGRSIRIVAMVDATHLLDQPDCAQRFLDEDVAPYGVELWPAATMLAGYITGMNPPPRRTLEIGCGLGLVSIVAARLGWTILGGDHEPSSLVFARENARLNHVTTDVFVTFDWNAPPALAPFDCVLGADILYQLNNHAPILRCLSRLLAPSGEALLSDPNRGVADRFPGLARASGFDVETSAACAPGPAGPVSGRIFRLYRPACP